MATRQAACEACRKAKLACDHKVPACTRCENNNRGDACVYRTHPFKRKRMLSPPREIAPRDESVSVSTSPTSSSTHNVYPNPGYLGESSHVAIFDHIPPDTHQESGLDGSTPGGTGHNPQSLSRDLIEEGAKTLREVMANCDLAAMKSLIVFWMAKGVNLALAEPIVEYCAESMARFVQPGSANNDWYAAQSRLLFRNSVQPLDTSKATNASNFSNQFCGDNIRWETLGIFFTAVARATYDISFFPPLYKSSTEYSNIRKRAAKLSDSCLANCLALDCLNDLQLICQYENFIIRSFVNGDHSYHAWRRLGDVIASIFALGYHQKIEQKPDVPWFLAELRRTVFARVYSADKNVAIFLGRPPRMSKKFCYFQIPLSGEAEEVRVQSPDMRYGVHKWATTAEFNYKTETRWSALCAIYKEEVLELFSSKEKDNFQESVNIIQSQAVAQWDALPSHFKLQGSLKGCMQSPFGRDLLVSARLNYLHVLFMLRLLSIDRLVEPGSSIVEISHAMLSLIVEAILFRDNIVNSGTGLVWKVTHYGLPAVGISLLSILRQRRVPSENMTRQQQATILQNLSVFVAEVEMGTIIKPDEPNYGLLSKATQTTRGILNFMESGERRHSPDPAARWTQGADDLASNLRLSNLDFELGFWNDLADYSTVLDFGYSDST